MGKASEVHREKVEVNTMAGSSGQNLQGVFEANEGIRHRQPAGKETYGGWPHGRPITENRRGETKPITKIGPFAEGEERA